MMLRKLYDYTMSLAAKPHAEKSLATISFVESSFFPIPPDVLLIPMVLADRSRWLRLAFICTLASVAGALLGYAIGAFLYDYIGAPLLAFYGAEAAFDKITALYKDWGSLAVLFGALSPFPYKVLTIFSGATHFNIWLLIVFSIVGRGARFFIVAWLLHRFGEPIRTFIEKNLGLLFTLFMILLIGGFAAIKYLA